MNGFGMLAESVFGVRTAIRDEARELGAHDQTVADNTWGQRLSAEARLRFDTVSLARTLKEGLRAI